MSIKSDGWPAVYPAPVPILSFQQRQLPLPLPAKKAGVSSGFLAVSFFVRIEAG